MMEKLSLHDRGKALEDEYFRRVDESLLNELRKQDSNKERLADLSVVAQLHDEALLGRLLELDIDAGNFAAFMLTPLVFVAWADGQVAPSENQSVISAALRSGVNGHPLAFKLLEHWLHTRPSRELWRLWKTYASTLHHSLPPATADKIAKNIHQQAVEVAKANGGFLGVGSICESEQRLLDEIRDTLPEHTQK